MKVRGGGGGSHSAVLAVGGAICRARATDCQGEYLLVGFLVSEG